jgi:maltose O-acetyltransferase
MRILAFIAYVYFAKYLPTSYTPLIGKISKAFRRSLATQLFEEVGVNVNLERGVSFGYASKVIIGNNSGIGVNCVLADNIRIGEDVMIGPDVLMIRRNHGSAKIGIPMRLQDYTRSIPLVIEDDVWIGERVIILPKVERIGRGSVIGAGAVLTRSVEEYTIMGGNPARIIGRR